MQTSVEHPATGIGHESRSAQIALGVSSNQAASRGDQAVTSTNFTLFAALLTAAGLAAPASAQDAAKLKVGLMFTLSGPAAVLGEQGRDGFLLAVDNMGGKLGGLETEVV